MLTTDPWSSPHLANSSYSGRTNLAQRLDFPVPALSCLIDPLKPRTATRHSGMAGDASPTPSGSQKSYTYSESQERPAALDKRECHDCFSLPRNFLDNQQSVRGQFLVTESRKADGAISPCGVCFFWLEQPGHPVMLCSPLLSRSHWSLTTSHTIFTKTVERSYQLRHWSTFMTRDSTFGRFGFPAGDGTSNSAAWHRKKCVQAKSRVCVASRWTELVVANRAGLG